MATDVFGMKVRTRTTKPQSEVEDVCPIQQDQKYYDNDEYDEVVLVEQKKRRQLLRL